MKTKPDASSLDSIAHETTRNFRATARWLGIFGAVAVAAHCGTTTSKIGSQGSNGATEGQACTEPGSRAQAEDGCNECTCTNAQWACTHDGCGGADAAATSSSPTGGPGGGTTGASGGPSGSATTDGSASTAGSTGSTTPDPTLTCIANQQADGAYIWDSAGLVIQVSELGSSTAPTGSECFDPRAFWTYDAASSGVSKAGCIGGYNVNKSATLDGAQKASLSAALAMLRTTENAAPLVDGPELTVVVNDSRGGNFTYEGSPSEPGGNHRPVVPTPALVCLMNLIDSFLACPGAAGDACSADCRCQAGLLCRADSTSSLGHCQRLPGTGTSGTSGTTGTNGAAVTTSGGTNGIGTGGIDGVSSGATTGVGIGGANGVTSGGTTGTSG